MDHSPRLRCDRRRLGPRRRKRNHLVANRATFPANTAVVSLGDFGQSEGSLIENITVDCNHVPGSIGVFSDRVQELSGVRNVSVINYKAIGIEMLDQASLPPRTEDNPKTTSWTNSN